MAAARRPVQSSTSVNDREQAGKESGHGQSPPPFLTKTYDLIDNTENQDVVSWSGDGHSFVVWKPAEFSRDLLPKSFKHNNFSSFVRQLNTYGFRKVDPDRWEFSNDSFIKGQKDLLRDITRRKAVSGANANHAELAVSQQGQPAIEVGRYGGLEEEVEHLKRDKNVLMLELVRLRQQQQNTEQETQGLRSRLEATEQRQQQMTTFLTKAVQNPVFLQQLLNQRQAQRISGPDKSRKKRRAARGRTDVGDQPYEDPNMQVVVHQPHDNLHQQLLQMLSPPRIEEQAASQTSSPMSNKEDSPEPNWGDFSSRAQQQGYHNELDNSFSGLKLGLDNRVPSSVTISCREHMPHTASLPKMPDIPFPDSGAGPSGSDSQMEGLTGQPPFDAADVMSAATAPVSVNGYPAAQPSNIPAQASSSGRQATSSMDMPYPGSPFSAAMMQQHMDANAASSAQQSLPNMQGSSAMPAAPEPLPLSPLPDFGPMDMMGTTDYLLDQDASTMNSDNFWQQFLTQSPSGTPGPDQNGAQGQIQGHNQAAGQNRVGAEPRPASPVEISKDGTQTTSLDLLHNGYVQPAPS